MRSGANAAGAGGAAVICDDLLDGEGYLESLRDARSVYIHGEKVVDVTRHVAFRNSVRSVARLYDALHEPDSRNVRTEDGSG